MEMSIFRQPLKNKSFEQSKHLKKCEQRPHRSGVITLLYQKNHSRLIFRDDCFCLCPPSSDDWIRYIPKHLITHKIFNVLYLSVTFHKFWTASDLAAST